MLILFPIRFNPVQYPLRKKKKKFVEKSEMNRWALRIQRKWQICQLVVHDIENCQTCHPSYRLGQFRQFIISQVNFHQTCHQNEFIRNRGQSATVKCQNFKRNQFSDCRRQGNLKTKARWILLSDLRNLNLNLPIYFRSNSIPQVYSSCQLCRAVSWLRYFAIRVSRASLISRFLAKSKIFCCRSEKA